MNAPDVVVLATRQLVAYNNRDIDAFCECYADDVRVLDADGNLSLHGIEAFRSRYSPLFADHCVVAGVITERMTLGPHLVEKERWQRQKNADSPVESGEVVVRYTAKGGKIAVVQFFR